MEQNSWRRRAAALILLLAAFLGGLAIAPSAATGDAYLHATSADNPVALTGCVIRFSERTSMGNTRPTIHANSSHYCVGVRSVRADYPSGDLQLDTDMVGPVVFISVSPDETLTARDISCGASGGVGTVTIRCYRGGQKVKAYSPLLYGNTSNLWVGLASWDRSAA